jgi:hypothetical protein
MAVIHDHILRVRQPPTINLPDNSFPLLFAVKPSSSSSCYILKIRCPSCRVVLTNTSDDGGGAIGGEIAPPPPPPPRPPLDLLPEPHRAKVTGVSSAHHEELGGIWHLPQTFLVAPDQGLAADAKRRRTFDSTIGYRLAKSRAPSCLYTSPIA